MLIWSVVHPECVRSRGNLSIYIFAVQLVSSPVAAILDFCVAAIKP